MKGFLVSILVSVIALLAVPSWSASPGFLFDRARATSEFDGTNPVKFDFYYDPTTGAQLSMFAFGTVVPTDAAAGYAPGCLFIEVDASTGDSARYINVGTKTSCNFDLQEGVQELADLSDSSTQGHGHAFTGTAATADATIVKKDASAATNGTPVYVGIKRAETSPAMLVSENANAATAYFATTPGALNVPVVYSPVEEADFVVSDTASYATLGYQLYLMPLGGPNRWGALECKLVADCDSRVNAIYQSATPTDTAVVHYVEELESIPIPLTYLRETSTGDIPNSAGLGGLLSKDSTPIFETTNGATDSCQRIRWVGTDVQPLIFQIPVPVDLDNGRDMRIHIRARLIKAGGSVVDSPTITCETFFDESDSKITDATLAVDSETIGGYYATIASADIKALAQTMTVVLTPSAHNTDALVVDAIQIQYIQYREMIPVYFDYDAVSTEQRFLQTNLYAADAYVRMASGRPWRFKYHATASSTGVSVYFDDDLTATGRFLYNSPAGTPTNGAATSGSASGFNALDGLTLTAAYVDATAARIEFVNPAEVDVPIWTLSGNREFKAYYDDVATDGKAIYFDDNGATASQRLCADTAASVTVSAETTERPFWLTPAGTNASRTVIDTAP